MTCLVSYQVDCIKIWHKCPWCPEDEPLTLRWPLYFSCCIPSLSKILTYCLNDFRTDGLNILNRHSWSPEDERFLIHRLFPSKTIRITFLFFWGEISTGIGWLPCLHIFMSPSGWTKMTFCRVQNWKLTEASPHLTLWGKWVFSQDVFLAGA